MSEEVKAELRRLVVAYGKLCRMYGVEYEASGPEGTDQMDDAYDAMCAAWAAYCAAVDAL